MNEKNGFGAFAKYRQEGQPRHGPSRLAGERLVGALFEVSLPGLRVLAQEQPSADIEHKGGSDQDHDALDQVVVLARVELLEHPCGRQASQYGG